MRTKLKLAIGCCVVALVSGCGGGLNPSSSHVADHGKAIFTVTWPARSRLIPIASNSVVVTVSNATNVVSRQVLARPSSGGSASVSFPDLPVGTLSIAAAAAPNTDGSGVSQASASAPLVIQSGATTPINLTLASTISQVKLSVPTQTLMVGDTETLLATAYDSSGNIVLTSPTTLQWNSANSDVSVVNGLVTAVSSGSVTVSVKEQESGQSQSTTLTVSPGAGSASQQSVAYQINPAHTGNAVFGKPLAFPSSPTWSVDFGSGNSLSYPVIAGGRVYVMGTSGSLYCLDENTGATLWGPTAGGFRALTYDGGKVFILSLGGTLRAFDAVTGLQGWSVQLPGQYNFDATPTAVNGTVYAGGAGSGGTVYAVNETNGALLWSKSVVNGMQAAPAVTADGVYVSYPCQDYNLDPTTGATKWHYNSGCSGGGGKTETVDNGRVYDRQNGGVVFDATTGAIVDHFSSDRLPALNAAIACFLSGSTLSVKDNATNSVLWSFTGDGQLNSAPLIIDQTVIIGSGSGTVFALNAATGQQIWSGSAGAGLPKPDEQNVSVPLTGFGAGEGYLIVTAGSRLTAWRLVGP